MWSDLAAIIWITRNHSWSYSTLFNTELARIIPHIIMPHIPVTHAVKKLFQRLETLTSYTASDFEEVLLLPLAYPPRMLWYAKVSWKCSHEDHLYRLLMHVLRYFDLFSLAPVEGASTEHLRHRPSTRDATFRRHFRFLQSILAQVKFSFHVRVVAPLGCAEMITIPAQEVLEMVQSDLSAGLWLLVVVAFAELYVGGRAVALHVEYCMQVSKRGLCVE